MRPKRKITVSRSPVVLVDATAPQAVSFVTVVSGGFIMDASSLTTLTSPSSVLLRSARILVALASRRRLGVPTALLQRCFDFLR